MAHVDAIAQSLAMATLRHQIATNVLTVTKFRDLLYQAIGIA